MKASPNLKQHTAMGFSLIEVMVSLALFSIVMIIAMGAFLSVLDANRKAQALQISIDNTYFAFEHITRLIRTGTTYDCESFSSLDTHDCNGGSEFQFLDDTGRTIRFQLVNGVIEQQIRDATSGVWGNWFSLTAPDLDVKNLIFHVNNSTLLSSGNTEQPTVTLVIMGVVNEGKKTETQIKLQTTVAQRVLDL